MSEQPSEVEVGALLPEMADAPAASRALGVPMARALKGLAIAAGLFAAAATVGKLTGRDLRGEPVGAEASGKALRAAAVRLWAGEHQIAPAAPGHEAGLKLFCFMAVLPGSGEVELDKKAKQHHAGIYGQQCDYNKMYDSYPAPFVHQGSWNSFANTASFVKVWEHVFADGLYKQADWTVKADPDTVFMALRLKAHLRAARPPANLPIYFKNTGISFGFLGAFELMSKGAVDLLATKYKECEAMIGDHSGEDGYIKGCFDNFGVNVMTDVFLLQSSGDCWEKNLVAFHAHKDPGDWERCLEHMVDVETHTGQWWR